MQAPTAILFDIGDTLLEEQRFDLEAGISTVVADHRDVVALASAFRAELTARHREDREILLAQWILARVEALVAHTIDEIEDHIWRAVVTLTPSSGVLEMLNRLGADGIRVGAVSNAAFSGRVLRAELDRHGLADSLRVVLSSADLDSRKPAPRIFEAAVARVGVAASATWFVGDTIGEDIVGAARAALQPVWFSKGVANAMPASDVPIVRSWSDFLTLYDATINAEVG